ncbi:MAG: hypothetical protein KAJ19_09445 [Gammaproteobacteria bacterium]|nr:hypothetical protein [Gammaproteobacteria bacterium]
MVSASQVAHSMAKASVGKAHRMRLAVRLYRLGWQQKEIAAVLEVGANTVSKYIRQAKELYIRQATADVQKWVADCLLVLDDIDQTAVEQWHESLDQTRTKTKTKTVAYGGSTSETVEEWKERLLPNEVYLRIRLDVLKQRRELLDLDRQQAKVVELRGGIAMDKTTEMTQAEADAIAAAVVRHMEET